MRKLLLAVLLLAPSAANAKELIYEGTWRTTNRPLNGTMTCVVTDLGKHEWQGRFSGVWEGQAFSYTVRFSGPPERLRGRAEIDGADYEWTGQMEAGENGSFKGRFGGSRYFGSFELKRKSK